MPSFPRASAILGGFFTGTNYIIAIMGWFRAAPPGDPLVVAMTGVKLGDRLLIMGGSHTKTVGQLALKPGISGRAVIVDETESLSTRAAEAATAEGALIESETAPLTMLPFDDNSFDLVVVNHALAKVPEARRNQALTEARRVLRDGGRVVAIEPAQRGGLAALVSSGTLPSGDIERELTTAGFRAVRTLAEREGLAFIEGAKRS